jgi:hypothetical protein
LKAVAADPDVLAASGVKASTQTYFSIPFLVQFSKPWGCGHEDGKDRTYSKQIRVPRSHRSVWRVLGDRLFATDSK